MAQPRSAARLGILSVGLRAFTMLGKFVVLIVIGRYLSANDLGVYGLMFYTVTTSLMLLGLGFHMYTTRELCAPDAKHGSMIRDQFTFQGLLYLLFLPMGMLLFATGAMKWELLIPFYSLLVLEHISNEISRLLLPLRRPIESNFLMFIRNGLWIYILAGLMVFRPEFRKLEYVWWFWGTSAALSIIVGAAWLYHLAFKGQKLQPIDWSWIKRGVSISIIFCLYIVLFNGIMTVDRHILEKLGGGLALVGVYTFFFTISNIIPTVAETGAALVLFPQMFAAYAKGDMADYKAKYNQFRKSVLLSLAFTTVAAALVIWPATFILKKSEVALYQQNLPAYALLLLTGVFAALNHIPHYDLYARGKEKLLLATNAIGFALAVILHLILAPRYGLLGTAIATTCSFATLVATKTFFAHRFPPAAHSPQPDVMAPAEVTLEYDA